MLGLLLMTLVRTRWPNARFHTNHDECEPGVVTVTNLITGASLIVYSVQPPAPSVAENVSVGNRSLLTYDASAEELMAGLRALEGGPTYICRQIVRLIAGKSGQNGQTLTAREQQVVALVVKGYSNNEIASELFVSPHTVRTHLQSVSSRLGVNSRGRLAAKVRELGLA